MRLSVRTLSVALLVVAGCSKSTEGPVATTVAVTPAAPLTFASLNQTAQLSAVVLDQHSDTLAGQAITWASSNVAVATVNTTGLVTSKSNGTATITATGAGLHTDIVATVAQVPSSGSKNGDNQAAPPSTALVTPATLHVSDAGGSPIAGATVNFAITTGGGSVNPPSAVTNASGDASTTWTLGAAGGTQTMTATVSGLGGFTFSANAVVVGAPSHAIIAGGNGQAANQGAALPQPIQVQLLDGANNPTPGITVTFAVTSGGGQVSPLTASTNGSGIASTTWTTGSASVFQTATASATGVPAVTFTGNGVGSVAAGFQITVVNIGPPFKPEVKTAFDSAVAFWQRVIVGDLPDAGNFTIAANSCLNTSAVGPVTVDDVIILANFDAIDGPRGILGQAGPCAFIRSAPSGPSISGTMKFDTADVDTLIAHNVLNQVIRHEMGHVLGFGTFWTMTASANRFNCLQNPASTGNAPDTFFNCPQALAAFGVIGGNAYTGGQKVPVENCGTATTAQPPTGLGLACGQGNFNSHWREPVFDIELMTGYLNPNTANPFSRVSVGAMEDLGYVVDYSASEAYTPQNPFHVPPASFQLIPTVVDLHDDLFVAPGPIYTIDSRGRVSGVARP